MKTQNAVTAAQQKAKICQVSVSHPAVSKRQLERMGNTVIEKLQKEVGVNCFMNILEKAAFAMLDDIQCGNGQTDSIRLIQLFPKGCLSEAGRAYVEEAGFALLSEEWEEWACMEDIINKLISVLDYESFRYFEAKYASQRRAKPKRRIKHLN